MVSHICCSRGFSRSNWDTSSSSVRSAGDGGSGVMVEAPGGRGASVYASALRGGARGPRHAVLVQLHRAPERLRAPPHLAVEVVAHRPHEREVGGEVQALVARVV